MVEGLLNKNNKGQGGKGIFALSSPSPRAEKQGRKGGSPVAARAGGSGREGPREGPVPGRGSAGGGPRWPSHDGRRQRVAVVLGRRIRGVVAVMEVGESTGGLCGVDYPAHLGQG